MTNFVFIYRPDLVLLYMIMLYIYIHTHSNRKEIKILITNTNTQQYVMCNVQAKCSSFGPIFMFF